MRIENSSRRQAGRCPVPLSCLLGGSAGAAELRVAAQKVSNVILNVNVYARRVAAGERVGQGGVGIRGNTDESALRGVDVLWTGRAKGQPEVARR